jgi:hypothetical protein
MSHYPHSENGHITLLFITLLTSLALIILAIAFARSNPTLAYIGGIGAALLFIIHFTLVHSEFGKIYARIQALENKTQAD